MNKGHYYETILNILDQLDDISIEIVEEYAEVLLGMQNS